MRDPIAPSVSTDRQHTPRKARRAGYRFFATDFVKDGPLWAACRELLELREQVRKAELAVKSRRNTKRAC